jgi:hypothetical protein
MILASLLCCFSSATLKHWQSQLDLTIPHATIKHLHCLVLQIGVVLVIVVIPCVATYHQPADWVSMGRQQWGCCGSPNPAAKRLAVHCVYQGSFVMAVLLCLLFLQVFRKFEYE